jgi:phosphoglycolate phosphatase
MDYDPVGRRAIAGGPLAVTPLGELRVLTAGVLTASRLDDQAAEAVLIAAWALPDPASTARALTPLPALFTALRDRGLQVAVATADDHAPTVATLASLGVGHLVDVVIAADDGIPLKPRPDMIWAACRATGVEPRQAIMVGDALPDLQMARAAGAGLAVGVTSGVSDAALLAPDADVILSNIAELVS